MASNEKREFNVVSRWKLLLKMVRIITPSIDITKSEGIYFDGKTIFFEEREFHNGNAVNELLVKDENGEILIVYSEDGQPEFISDWAHSSIDIEPYDFPLYEIV